MDGTKWVGVNTWADPRTIDGSEVIYYGTTNIGLNFTAADVTWNKAWAGFYRTLAADFQVGCIG